MELILGLVIVISAGVIISMLLSRQAGTSSYRTQVTPSTDEWSCDYCSNPESKHMKTHWEQLEAEARLWQPPSLPPEAPADAKGKKLDRADVKPKRVRKKATKKDERTPPPAVPSKKPRRSRSRPTE